MSYASEVLADAPLAWYRLADPGPTGTAMADSSGNGRHGAYQGTGFTFARPSLLTYGGDAAIGCTSANNTRGQTAYGAWMEPATLSVEAWVNPATTSGIGVIAARYGLNGGVSWLLRRDASRIYWLVYTNNGGFLETTAPNGTLVVNTTAHVVATFDGTRGRIYVNGQLVVTATATQASSPRAASGLPLSVFGHTGSNGTDVWMGDLDDVALYGSVLTAARVAAHYAAASTPPPPDPPAAPTGLAALNITPTAADLSWAPSSGGPVTGYQLRVDGGTATDLGDVTTHPLAGLTPLTGYTAEVRATGPGGASAWASVAFTTPDDGPPPVEADFRATVRLGAHTWDVEAGDPAELGPILPVSFGWSVPDDALGFPAQPDPDLCNLELVTADYAAMAGVDIGSTMRVSLWVTGGTRPLATFRGRVADMEAAPHPLGLSWRVLGVGYTADPGSRQVGTSAWPQESGDDRAARIMAEAGFPGWTAPTIGSTFESREPAPMMAREALEALSDEAVSAEGNDFGPARRVLVHPVTDDNGDLTPAGPFAGAAVYRRTDALDLVSAGLVNRATSWRRTKLLDATWVRIDHPGGPSTFGDTRGPAYPPQSVSVTDPRELADLILDTTPGYRWLTGQPLRLELWADDGPAQAVVSHWFYRDADSPPFPWSGRAVVVSPIANSPDGSPRYAGMLTAATIRLEHVPGAGGRLVVEFRLRPDVPADSTVTMRWMDEPAGATWADELAEDPTGTWFDYYTRPRP